MGTVLLRLPNGIRENRGTSQLISEILQKSASPGLA